MRRTSLLLCVLLVGCSGSSPTAPSQSTPLTPIQLAGMWTGSLSFTLDGTSYSHAGTATLTQDQLHVAGTANLSSDWRVNVDGILSGPGVLAQITAHITLDVPSNQPPIRCTAALDATSSQAVPTMTFSADSVTFSPCADTITNVALTLRR